MTDEQRNYRTLQEIADKLDWEGGIEAGLSYFGREINSTDIDFNAMWRVAYDAFEAVNSALPEPGSYEDEESEEE